MMIVAIGLSIFLRNIYQYFVGGDTHQYSPVRQPGSRQHRPDRCHARRTSSSWSSRVVVLVAVVARRCQRTRLGKATRAVADNPALAAASGIDVDRVIRVVWIVGGAARRPLPASCWA